MGMRDHVWMSALVLVAGCAPAMQAAGDSSSREVVLMNAQGQRVGMAQLVADARGTRITLDGTALPAGTHGVHIHENGMCEAPSFTTAGGHYNPGGKQHGLRNPQGHHLGDLPNLVVGADGIGHLDAVVAASLMNGTSSLMKPGGTSLVIHATADDQVTDPSGNSGARIACGVISR